MNIGDLIVIAGISVAVIVAMIVLINSKRKGKGCCNCSGGCNGCNQSLLKMMESKDDKD
ncbi:MAG: hypothetical protein PUK35_06330 [Methanomassiliicoccales archaeon]|uniref:FeoB-associated Cys-rich membrane protein n=1 Tax=Candidatus Methanarcanum hacksteinii TaxID=2911857 RepID=UPI0037604753|nr:hypothetical protein [Methanomassiliicoccales archaeon]MDD7479443.1 hypothetical protein [Methanomassiliicoccales archaeon]